MTPSKFSCVILQIVENFKFRLNLNPISVHPRIINRSNLKYMVHSYSSFSLQEFVGLLRFPPTGNVDGVGWD
jgi:hypothetical protein